MPQRKITSPDDAALGELCSRLKELGGDLDRQPAWPAEQLRLCGEYGVYEWFLDTPWGGQAWNEEEIVRGYLALSGACLTTTFILTQRTGACKRIAGSDNEAIKPRLLPKLASGELFATVGISHLTTSRRHLAKPVLTVREEAGGFVLDGFSPWVTGGQAADFIVVGATAVEGDEVTEKQALFALPTNLPGVSVPPATRLVGVSASQTGPVQLEQVRIGDEWRLAGPVENVMQSGIGATTGGHETSTLALGLAAAAIEFVRDEASRRSDLEPPSDALEADHAELLGDLLALARGEPTCTKESLRQRANSLALRASQAALAAAKGTGYVIGHPAGRWCREALFFLVWSCPQPVASAHLCELAGIES